MIDKFMRRRNQGNQRLKKMMKISTEQQNSVIFFDYFFEMLKFY